MAKAKARKVVAAKDAAPAETNAATRPAAPKAAKRGKPIKAGKPMSRAESAGRKGKKFTGKRVPTPAERAERHAERAQTLATRTARFTGRSPDSADGPPLAEVEAFPHPHAGTEVDQVGGVAEVAHKAGVYGLDSRDYADRLEALGAAVGAPKAAQTRATDDLSERDRWNRLVALHDTLIKAAREGNTVDDVNVVLADVGLVKSDPTKKAAKGRSIADVKGVLAEHGLLPGNL